MLSCEFSQGWWAFAVCQAWACLASLGTEARASGLAVLQVGAAPIAAMASECMPGAGHALCAVF